MHHQLLTEVVLETAEKLTGRFLGRVIQLSKLSFALDFGLRNYFLLISADPSSPRFYLIERRSKDLDKLSIPLSRFGQQLRTNLAGAKVNSVRKNPLDRIVFLEFAAQ